MKNIFLLALLALASIASAEILVYEGFHPEDYKNVGASSNVGAHEGKTTGEYTIGLTQTSWNKMNGTQIRVFGEDRGLTLSEYMISKGFVHQGGSIVYCANGNGTKCNDFGKFNYLTDFGHEKSSQIALAA